MKESFYPESKGDRSSWPKGEWDDEPDRIEWRSPDDNIVRLMKRNTVGAWCGYVGVPPGHPWHGTPYQDLEEVEVHGGLTYSAHCDGDQEHGICHVPNPGEADHAYWLGFDCGHYMDMSPVHWARLAGVINMDEWTHDSVYRNQSYVMAEVEKLAEQAKEQQ